MKRCPHCEFIYEDDQSHCDMDGTILAHDSRPLPKLQALSSTSEPDSRWRSRAVPVFASALLAIVLGVVYVVSIRQVEPNAGAASESTTVEMPASDPNASIPAQPVTETTNAATDPAPQTETDTTSHGRETDSDTGAEAKKPADTRSDKQNAGRNTKPAKNQKNAGAKEPPEKDDSKVRSILKKTGRFFKKTLPL